MMPIRNLNIAVIGDEDLVSGLRLAGVGKYYMIEGDQDTGEEVRRALTELIAESEFGIIALQEEFAPYVEDLLVQVKESRNLTPVIIEVPTKYGSKNRDVTEYYKAYIRRFTGFDIEI